MYVGSKYGARNKVLSAQLSEAIQLDYKQVDDEQIRKTTGWFRGKYDQRWRYEVVEQIKLPTLVKNRTVVLPLSDVVYDPVFFKAYPKARRYHVTFRLLTRHKDYEAVFWSPDPSGERCNEIVVKACTLEEIYTAFVHELQHLIQYCEGFAKGGDWTEFKGTERQQLIEYHRLAGEIESRDVESRLSKSHMQRYKTKPFSGDRCRIVHIRYY